MSCSTPFGVIDRDFGRNVVFVVANTSFRDGLVQSLCDEYGVSDCLNPITGPRRRRELERRNGPYRRIELSRFDFIHVTHPQNPEIVQELSHILERAIVAAKEQQQHESKLQ